MPFDVNAVRRDFPMFSRNIVYLDNAATAQKPRVMLDAMRQFYETSCGNINRGVHELAERATVAYESARKTAQQFINAKQAHEVIFVRNSTEGINLVARSWGDANVKNDDAIAVSIVDHHSNIVPWLQLKDRIGSRLEWIGIDGNGELNLDELDAMLRKKKVKIVAICAISNVLGTRVPVKDVIRKSHDAGALVLVDASQLAPHAKIDVQDLDCDFLVFSGHKTYGPTGIGVLYGKADILNGMPPFLGGGDMIQTVEKDHFTAAELPRKFEAGTPAIAEAVGLEAALTWMNTIGMDAIEKHEASLLEAALQELDQIKELKVLGSNDPKKIASCISFTVDGIHPHDLTQMLSDKGFCLRAGHHCTQPLHKHLGITASSRLSVAVYNTKEEIHLVCDALKSIITDWHR